MRSYFIVLIVFVVLFLLMAAIIRMRELRQIKRKVHAMNDPNLLLLYHKLQNKSESLIYKKVFVDAVVAETQNRKLI